MGDAMSATRRRGRPLSAEAIGFLAVIAREPLPARLVADALQISQPHADRIAHSLTSRGYAYVLDQRAPTEGRRPVDVYAPKLET
jgi:hypothetical protein